MRQTTICPFRGVESRNGGFPTFLGRLDLPHEHDSAIFRVVRYVRVPHGCRNACSHAVWHVFVRIGVEFTRFCVVRYGSMTHNRLAVTGDPVWHAIFARTSTGSAVYRIAAMQSGTHESCTGPCIANWRYLFSGTPMQITNGNVIHHFFRL